MPNITITHEEVDDAKRNVLEQVTAVFSSGAWAVTPARRPEVEGFVVTHIPTGTHAWPNPKHGTSTKAPMSAAISKCKELRDIWDKPTQTFTDVVRTKIAAAVGVAC